MTDEWVLKNLHYLSEGSYASDNMGQVPMRAKYKRVFLNLSTGEINEVTDLQSKLHKRDKNLHLFFDVYAKYHGSNYLSIFSMVVNQEEYPSITKFINTITRKLKRKGIERLGYVWVRDVGEEVFRKHYHVLLATSEIDAKLFRELFCKKYHNHYRVQFLKFRFGMKNYIIKKDLFGDRKHRAYGKSRLFPLPKKFKCD
jgi:hypothetical protein